MQNNLQKYFPIIRERDAILAEIKSKENLLSIFENWSEEYQEEFLDICTGVRGVKILYDSFFKEILNPELVPERMNRFLSLLLGENIKIIKVLPNDSTRIADESTLLITDIVVELENGSIANVEAQKIGYAFPGQRSACYSADLLLRQYKRIRNNTINSSKKRKFNYRDIKKVYTIVLFEKSSREFHAYPNNYIHRTKQISDTGINIELLQEFIFLPLDIFRENLHNKGIHNELDAWLTFLSTDEPEYITYLCENYPIFKNMYEEIYIICQNVERVMNMFSKELIELDQGTVQYMIDEMQDTINKQNDKIIQQQKLLEKLEKELAFLKNNPQSAK